MNYDLNLVIYYNKSNRYSFNALLGAVENLDELKDLKVIFIEKRENLFNLSNFFDKNKKTIFAFSFFTTQIFEIFEIIKNLREIYKDKAIFIAGGPHPTGDPIGTLKLGFDYVFRGEGEDSFTKFLLNLKIDNFENLKYLSYIENGEFKISPLNEPVDINSYPPFSIKYEKFSPIEITRGCPHFCYYCQTPFIFGGKTRHRTIENIIKYIEIMKKINLTDIRFITPNAFSYGSIDGKKLNLEALETLLKEIKIVLKDSGRIFLGTFPSEVRPEFVLDETLLLVKKYAYNTSIVIGAQSGSEKVLKSINRGHGVKEIYKSVELSIKYNLKPIVDFIFGLPGEEKEDIEETLKVMKDLIKLGARIHAHTFIPLPMTPFQFEKSGRVNEKLKSFIKENFKGKIIFGDWGVQQKLGKKIENYFKSGFMI
ncbi:MAG: TIGR04013 family B12-binding domain/radical SAM domain-containing protein [Caldisericia bacterium]|nr:TIGR04013 family B12-binding domain/radical SAM domain-containing protein [Caldisericia bacterium]